MTTHNLRLILFACILTGFVHAQDRQGRDGRTAADGSTAGQGQVRGAEVTVERMGGYAGVYERYEVFADGAVRGPRGDAGKLVPRLVAEFVDGVRIAGARGSGGGRMLRDLCSDCFYYRVTVRAGGVVKIYRFAEPMKANSAHEEQILRSIRAFFASLPGPDRHTRQGAGRRKFIPLVT